MTKRIAMSTPKSRPRATLSNLAEVGLGNEKGEVSLRSESGFGFLLLQKGSSF